MSVLNKVRETLEEIGVRRGASILVACSGGPDSVALLLVLFQLATNGEDYHLTVAHFNHKLRGKEADEDAQFVVHLANSLGLECVVGSGDVRARKRETGETTQEAARALRYKFLLRVRQEKGIHWIATAHTADDQAEEVILRLLRGASLAGISGIPIRTEQGVIRPLLRVEKRQLLDFLEERGQAYRLDTSNFSPKYLRNLVRREVIPIFKEFNPAFLKAVSRTTKALSEDEAYLNTLARQALEGAVVSWEKGQLVLLQPRLRDLAPPILRRILKMVLREVEPRALGVLRLEHLDGLICLIKGDQTTKEVTLPKQIVAKRVYDRLKFYKKDRLSSLLSGCAAPDQSLQRLDRPCRVDLFGNAGILELKRCDKRHIFDKKKRLLKRLYVDAQKLRFPLTVRPRRAGERFWPIGAPRPYKLKEFLISRKVPRDVRPYLPIILSGNDVAAVAGVEVSELYKVTPGTKQVIEVTWEPPMSIKRELIPYWKQ